jgi:hypothetical protein
LALVVLAAQQQEQVLAEEILGRVEEVRLLAHYLCLQVLVVLLRVIISLPQGRVRLVLFLTQAAAGEIVLTQQVLALR